MKGRSATVGVIGTTSIDRRALFFGLMALLALVSLSGFIFLHGLIAEHSRAVSKAMTDAQRMQRIGQQTWWIEESQTLAREVDGVRKRFWKGKTIGLVRADIERFIQGLVTANGLKASSLLVDGKTTDTKGIALLQVQLKANGPTQNILKMIDGIAGGQQEVFVSGAQIRFFKEQATAELTLDAPTLIGQE